MQQHWLRQQNELVKKTKEADEQSKTVDNLKKQLVIMEQKRLRIDGVCVCCVCLSLIDAHYHKINYYGVFGGNKYILLTEGELVQQQSEAKTVERNISQLQHDMVKLNTLVAKKKSEQESLEQGNLLMEGDFVHALKVCINLVHVHIFPHTYCSTQCMCAHTRINTYSQVYTHILTSIHAHTHTRMRAHART